MEDKIRKKIRIKIVLISLVTILVIGSIIYFLVKPSPNCHDGIINQGERKTDCGGPCLPCIEEVVPIDLEVLGAEVVHYVGNEYDVAIRIKNKNGIFGASQIKFKIFLEGDNGEDVTIREETKDYYVLPKEEKYLIVQGISTETRPSQVRIEFQEVAWEKFAQYEEPRLIISRPVYTENPEEGGFSKITGVLSNKSNVDFETIKVNAILKDENDKLLATNYQVLENIRADEQRDFIMFFSNEFPGSVVDVIIEPETDVFNSENYIKSFESVDSWEL